jgi:hypothetical protein
MDKNPERDIEKELDETSFRSYAVYVGGKLLAHGLNLNKLADMAIDMFVELLRVESGYLMLFNELSVKSVKGLKQKHIERKISIKTENEVIKWIIDWRKPILQRMLHCKEV